MENLLQGINGVCVYIDDILITGATQKEHLNNLAQVLQRLESTGMCLKKQKCAFLLPSVSYLGHVISAEGLHTEETKVRAIVEAPEPQNVGELRSFLGMVNYYGKILPDLATTLSPLYWLLREATPWRWEQKQREAFQCVKTCCGFSPTTTISCPSFWPVMHPPMDWEQCCHTECQVGKRNQ